MAGLSSPGIGSGLDISGLVTRLMEAEKQPLTRLDRKEAAYQAKLTAYGTLKGALSSFQTAVSGLASPHAFGAVKGTVADSAIASITTTSAAKPASYSLEVTHLAEAQKLTSSELQRIADPTAAIGTGTLTINFGTTVGATFSPSADKTSKTITISDSNSSLNGIRDAINAAGAGVTANIINDGQGYRLVIASNDTGADNSLRITVAEDGGGDNFDMSGLSQFAYDPTKTVYDAGIPGSGGKNLGQTIAAKSAEFELDGIPMTASSNTVTTAIQGVTLTLLKTSAAATTTAVSIARDPSGVKTAVNGFVKAYNDLVKTMKELGGYDEETKKGGILLGDSGLRGIQEQVRRLVSQRQSGASSTELASLSDIGVSFQRDGTLAVNATKLDKVLADPTKNVGLLFATMGAANDSLISYASSTSVTKAGVYGVVLTQVPRQGSATGTADVSNVTIGDSNKSLGVIVDGLAINITLDAGDYTASTLAAALQSKINSDATLVAQGKSVKVSQSDNHLSIKSNLYGASSSVAIAVAGGYADLFGSVTTVSGQDAAGSIGGVPATGDGQKLTGEGDATGLQLLIEGGSVGTRGTVTFSRGLAFQLNQSIQAMLTSRGTLTSQTDGLSRSIKDLGLQREVLKDRLVDTEKRYRAQFNALDKMVAQMQQTSNYLQQQLSALAKQTSSQ